ncbi:uncharacterized protein [Anabrus simplex]|uniref:uncharacterized protein isoform X2 n=1 Tax=Anabrus simplex TaxID=316456 RepID=UPI0035A3A479
MDMEQEMKEERFWLASTSHDLNVNTAVDNDCIVKVESQTSFIPEIEKETFDARIEHDVSMPAAAVKGEVVIEESTVDQLVPTFKEENNLSFRDFPNLTHAFRWCQEIIMWII